jgi:HD domain-containing protein
VRVSSVSWVNRTRSGPYRDLRFSADELRELRYAALLHDFGKVGVREHLLVKAKKLYPADLDRIRERIELLTRELELGATRRKLDWAVHRGQPGYAEQAARLDAELATAVTELNEALDVILTMNEPSVHAQDFTSQLLRITARSWEDHHGRRRTLLTPDEASVLAIARGSLTDAERREIQQHVVHTFQFLTRIPWTRELRRVPEIARSHHEKLDGSGYPSGSVAEHIPVQSRMMTIADIYDALTAGDRPYKKAVRAEEALDTLRHEQRAGALDPHLLELFIDARVFERTDRRRRRAVPAPDSGAEQHDERGPGDDTGERERGTHDLPPDGCAVHALSGLAEKKGARTALGNQTTLQRRIRDGVCVHDGLPASTATAKRYGLRSLGAGRRPCPGCGPDARAGRSRSGPSSDARA